MILTIALLASTSSLLQTLPTKGRPIGSPVKWIAVQTFPPSELERATITRYQLMIDPAGLPTRCSITMPSGSPIIDNGVCSSLLKKSKYIPAKDVAGNAIAEAQIGRVRWHAKDVKASKFREVPDLLVTTPVITSEWLNVTVRVFIIYNKFGDIEQCILEKPADRSQLNEQACKLASRSDILSPVTNADGAPVRGLRHLQLVFTKGETERIALY